MYVFHISFRYSKNETARKDRWQHLFRKEPPFFKFQWGFNERPPHRVFCRKYALWMNRNTNRVLSKNQFFSHFAHAKQEKGIICISPAKQEISVLLILKENASNFVKIIWWLYRPKWAWSEAPVRASGVGRSQHPIAMISGSLACNSEIRSEVIRFKFGKSLWRCN